MVSDKKQQILEWAEYQVIPGTTNHLLVVLSKLYQQQ